jgi:monoamine oxidase
VNVLAAQARRAGATLALGCIVKSISWKPGAVTVRSRHNTWTAKAAVIALPLGVLQAKTHQRGAVAFRPALRQKQKLISRMRMGHVIRLTLRFDPRAWRSLLPETLQPARAGFGFIHSGIAGVPVWWSLSRQPLLTGWVGGPPAVALARRSKCGLREKALSSLAEIFGVPKTRLRAALVDYATHNWSRDPFTRGAYSFTVAGQENAAEKLREPMAHTLFFAGEATAEGAEVGTVHGALASGLRAAKEARAKLK